ncbi:OB-fold-containig protein [Aureimonas psammosilenae]|uniref:OB-fold-containig protein n=1 Tax=Aureimonas psammosilenae TaxID=2495496 RepID=UPI0012611A1D|nr:OB-fold-containig protein [Aureimonas psammosilenae]
MGGLATGSPFFLYPLAAGLLLGLLQIVLYFVGHFPFSDAIEQALEGTAVGEAFDWLNFGKVPFAILLMLLCVTFGAAGIALTHLLPFLPAWSLSVGAAPAAIVVTKLAGDAMARLLPKDETYAVSAEEFVGLEGSVTLGPLDDGPAGNVAVRDRHGEVHTLRARPVDPGTVIAQGSHVVVVARDDTHKGRVFLVMPFAT